MLSLHDECCTALLLLVSSLVSQLAIMLVCMNLYGQPVLVPIG